MKIPLAKRVSVTFQTLQTRLEWMQELAAKLTDGNIAKLLNLFILYVFDNVGLFAEWVAKNINSVKGGNRNK